MVLLLTCAQASATTANTLDLNSYLASYFKQNENKKNIDLDKDIQIQESKSLANNYDGLIAITPARNQNKDKNLQPSWERQDKITASYTQNLPTGTQVTIGGTKFLNNRPASSIFFDPQVDNSYFFRLEQDLWRNGLGYNNLFMNSYRDQKAYLIYKELNESAKKTFATTKRSYQQKLTRKVDYLASQADLVNNEQRLIEASLRKLNSMKEISTSISKNINSDTSLTLGANKSWTTKLKTLSSDYTQLYDENIKASKQNHLSQKNLQVPEVKLYAEGAKNNNQFTTALNTADLETFGVGVNINIPINNKSLKSKSKTSYYKWQKAENEKSYQLKKLNNDLQTSIVQNEQLEQQLNILKKQQLNLKRLSSEARRLLRTGSIEFSDYTRYRDQQYNNELAQIEIQKKLLSGQIAIALLTQPQTNLCMQNSNLTTMTEGSL